MTDKSIDKRVESLRVFSQTAKIYDRIGPQIFSYFGQCLVDLADLNSGDKVLDVAAGKGALLFPVAAKVGPTGYVTAAAKVGFNLKCRIITPLKDDGDIRGGQPRRP